MTSLNFLNLFLESLYLTLLINLELKMRTLLGILTLKVIVKTPFSRSLIILT